MTSIARFLIIFILAASTVCAEDTEPEAPSLATLVAKEVELSQNFVYLKNSIKSLPDLKQINDAIAQQEMENRVLEGDYKALKFDESQSYHNMLMMRKKIQDEEESLDALMDKLEGKIDHLYRLAQKWSHTETLWSSWRKSYNAHMNISEVQNIFRTAESTISEAKNLIDNALSPLLSSYTRGANAMKGLYALSTDLSDKINTAYKTIEQDHSQPMYTLFFWESLSDLSKQQLVTNTNVLPLVDEMWNLETGWALAIIALAIIMIGLLIYKKRSALELSTRFVKHPFSLAALICFSVTWVVCLFTLPSCNSLVSFLIWLVFARLISCYPISTLERWTIYGATLFLLTLKIFPFFLPTSYFRLYMLIVSGVGFFLMQRLLKTRSAERQSLWYATLLRIVQLLAICAIIALIIGKTAFTLSLYKSVYSIFALAIIFRFAFMLLSAIITYLFTKSTLARLSLFRKHGSDLADTIDYILFAGAFFCFAVLSLTIWDSSNRPFTLINRFFEYNFTIGQQTFTVSVIVTAILGLYLSFFFSHILQTILSDQVYPKSRIPAAAGLSINRLVHYGILILGAIFALTVLGFSMTNVTILGGAVGVGIGFGLQEFVKNFVSGIILLFERPIKVGDQINVKGLFCTVKRIGLRATQVLDRDNAEIIIPNWDLITSHVTNWSHSWGLVKARIAMGVSYDSDLKKVTEVVLDCAKQNPNVVDDPEPTVYFKGFGDSSIDFDLIAFSRNFAEKVAAQNTLIPQITERFRVEGIEIPFPQSDLHVRSVDEKVSRLWEVKS